MGLPLKCMDVRFHLVFDLCRCHRFGIMLMQEPSGGRILCLLLIYLFIFFPGNLRLNTMLCWQRLVSIITLATTLSLEQHVVNTSGSALWPLLILVTRTSFVPCLLNRYVMPFGEYAWYTWVHSEVFALLVQI